MGAGTRLAHVTDVKESRDGLAKVMLPATSSSLTSLAVGQCWSGEAYSWEGRTNLHMLANSTPTAVRYRIRPYTGAGQCPASRGQTV